MPSCCLQVQLLGKRSAFGGELRFTLTGTEGLSGASRRAEHRLAIRMHRSNSSAKHTTIPPALAGHMFAQTRNVSGNPSKVPLCAAVPGGTEWGPQEVHDKQVGCMKVTEPLEAQRPWTVQAHRPTFHA